MIYIAGLGISGGYLLRRLKQEGFQVEGFDPKAAGFYVPCGYATNRFRLDGLLKNIGMSADGYIESEAGRITISTEAGRELNFPSKGLCTIDKNRMEEDMISGVPYQRDRAPNPNEVDILVDATGVSRYYLGAAENDFLMFTKEYLTGKGKQDGFYFRYFSAGKGYYWEFPLNGKFHVGAGGESQDIVEKSVQWVTDYEKLVSRKIRLSPLFNNISRGNIIGVGEAIGTVSPITGEGILPSMESAEILFQYIKKFSDLESLKLNYEGQIRKNFKRYGKLFQLLMNTRNGDLRKVGNLSAIRSAKEDFENFGIELKIGKVLKQLALK